MSDLTYKGYVVRDKKNKSIRCYNNAAVFQKIEGAVDFRSKLASYEKRSTEELPIYRVTIILEDEV